MANTNCFTRPRQGEKYYNELLQCLFFDGRRVVPDVTPTRNVSQVDGYLFRSVTQLVKQMSFARINVVSARMLGVNCPPDFPYHSPMAISPLSNNLTYFHILSL